MPGMYFVTEASCVMLCLFCRSQELQAHKQAVANCFVWSAEWGGAGGLDLLGFMFDCVEVSVLR